MSFPSPITATQLSTRIAFGLPFGFSLASALETFDAERQNVHEAKSRKPA